MDKILCVIILILTKIYWFQGNVRLPYLWVSSNEMPVMEYNIFIGIIITCLEEESADYDFLLKNIYLG